MDLSQLPDLVDNIKTKITQEFEDRILFAATLTLEGHIKERVFAEGKDKDGNKIGDYSKKPGYYTKKQFVRAGAFKPIGKNETGTPGTFNIYTKKEQTKPKKADTFNVKTRKKQKVAIKGDNTERTSMYFKDGYKGFRDVQGRQTATVDAKLSGSLEKSIKTVKLANNVTAIAITDARESKKRKGIEEHFNHRIFSAGQEDREIFNKAIKNEVDHIRNIDYTKL